MASTDKPPPCFLAKDPMDFDLADALDDKNDGKDAGRPDVRPGEGTLTPPLCPTCHQPRCLLGPAGDPPRPLPGTGSRCRTPSPPSEGVRRGRGTALPEGPARSRRSCPRRGGGCSRRQRSPFLGVRGEGRSPRLGRPWQRGALPHDLLPVCRFLSQGLF